MKRRIVGTSKTRPRRASTTTRQRVSKREKKRWKTSTLGWPLVSIKNFNRLNKVFLINTSTSPKRIVYNSKEATLTNLRVFNSRNQETNRDYLTKTKVSSCLGSTLGNLSSAKHFRISLKNKKWI